MINVENLLLYFSTTSKPNMYRRYRSLSSHVTAQYGYTCTHQLGLFCTFLLPNLILKCDLFSPQTMLGDSVGAVEGLDSYETI